MSSLSVRSDQWDIRINVVDQEWVDLFIIACQEYCDEGSVRYMHISGIELGDVPNRTSFGQLHIHVALILNNFTSKRSVVKRFKSDLGYYIEPRDKTKPLNGWVNYHSKARTKVNIGETLLFIYGSMPAERKRKADDTVEDKKTLERRKQWERKKMLMKTSNWVDLDYEFPGFIYSSMGQAMKRDVMKQCNDDFTKPLTGKLKNYIIWGPSGSGKSSSIALLYPNCYKKQKGSQYWDAYDKTNPDHSIVWIDEMSKETLKTFSGKMDGGFEFLKELADRYAVTVDEKYTKGYKIRPKKLIITMNEHPTSLLPDRAVEVNKQALFRKFKIMYVSVSNLFEVEV